MKSSSFEQAIKAQFDCLTKKVIKRAAMKYKRSISRRLQHEIPFSDVSDLELNKAGVYDNYSCDYTVFNVLGMEVQVSDDQLSKSSELFQSYLIVKKRYFQQQNVCSLFMKLCYNS